MSRMATGFLGLLLAGAASAQLPMGGPPAGWGGMGGVSRPTTSPYLNLLGRGNPAINYFGIVRPQQQFQNLISGGLSGPGIGQSEDPTDPELRRGTGHPATFDNLSHYYFNNPAVPTQRGVGGMGGRVGGMAAGMMGMPAGQAGMMPGGAMGRGMAAPGMMPMGGSRGFGRIR